MKRIISIWLCFVLVASSAFVLVGVEDVVVEGKVVVRDGVTYTTHAPIRIDSNADFGIGINGVSAGDGSAGNPWIIEGWDINGTGIDDALFIQNTIDFFIVKDNYFHDAAPNPVAPYKGAGITLINVHNGILQNNTCSNNRDGIYLNNTFNVTVSSCIGTSNGLSGITIFSSTNNTLSNLIMGNSSSGNGVSFLYSDYNVLEDSICLNNRGGAGLLIFASNSNYISNQKSLDCYSGIYSKRTNENIINNGVFERNVEGICFTSFCVNNLFTNNSIIDNNYGIYTRTSGSTNLENTFLYNNFINNTVQVVLKGSINCWNNSYPLCGNYWSNYTGNDSYAGPNQDQPGSDGIGDIPYIIDAGNSDSYPLMHPKPIYHVPIRINSNADFDAAHGITGGSGTSGDPWIIEGWDISGAGEGNCIFIGNTTEHYIVRDNYLHSANGLGGIYYNYAGVSLYNTQNGKIDGNQINTNTGDAVFIRGGVGLVVSNNDLSSNNGYGVTIMNLAAPFVSATDNLIFNNTIDNDGVDEITIYSGSGNKILNNTITVDSGGWGIYLWDDSTSTTIMNNSIFQASIHGIRLDSSDNNVIINNVIKDCNRGIYLYNTGTDNNIISYNTIMNCTSPWYGAIESTSFTTGNLIHHNNFINNIVQAEEDGATYINYWDDGYPSGGNYWDDYVGLDLNSTASQDIPPPDGIGDTPYTNIIGTAGSVDHYPLMYPASYSEVAPTIALETPFNNSINTPGIIISFVIYDSNQNLNVVNYSVNGGANQSFTIDYELDTTGWLDADYLIEVHANDTQGNTADKSYSFTIDSTGPVIILNSPVNNSVIADGTILDFDISDLHLNEVNYSINGGLNTNLPSPYDIDTIGWTDGLYTIEVRAIDDAGNTAVETYEFTIDSTMPIISLNSPGNNSVIQVGTILDFNVSDPHLNIVNYSVNGGANLSFPAPYDIDTTGWPDGTYLIEIHANDTVRNHISRSYSFIIDSTAPVITLNSPTNNSLIKASTVIDIGVSDANNVSVNYSVNGGSDTSLPAPYDINTNGWSDGTYTIEVHAIDEAGNTAIKIYEFMVDSTPPAIALNSPVNNSVIPVGTILDFNVSDLHLNIVNYSVNGGPIQILTPSYDIDTTGWADGLYVIEIHANDTVGNSISRSYNFIICSDDKLIFMI